MHWDNRLGKQGNMVILCKLKKERNKPTALVAANSLLFTKYMTSLILVSLNFLSLIIDLFSVFTSKRKGQVDPH